MDASAIASTPKTAKMIRPTRCANTTPALTKPTYQEVEMANGRNICSHENCNDFVLARQLCRKHYKRAERGLIPMPSLGRVRGGCSVEGCSKLHSVGGLCSMHHTRFLRHGDPKTTKTAPEGDGLKLLRSLVGTSESECVIWPFSCNPQGYGQTYFCSEVMGAHRVMCIMAHGQPKSPGLHAAHSCGNGGGGCVNPNHLRWATAQENIWDKYLHRGWVPKTDSNGQMVGIQRQ